VFAPAYRLHHHNQSISFVLSFNLLTYDFFLRPGTGNGTTAQGKEQDTNLCLITSKGHVVGLGIHWERETGNVYGKFSWNMDTWLAAREKSALTSFLSYITSSIHLKKMLAGNATSFNLSF